jgi:hypothetical protein
VSLARAQETARAADVLIGLADTAARRFAHTRDASDAEESASFADAARRLLEVALLEAKGDDED